MSFSVVELDGGDGLDLYNLFKSGESSHTFISDSGPADGTKDKIKVLANGPTVVNGFMNQTDVRYNNPIAPLTYDNSIEDVEVKVVDPKLFLTGNGFFRIDLDSVQFNGVTYPLAGVEELTITTTGDSSNIQIDRIPITLKSFTVNATAGQGDRLIGTDLNNQFVITGANSGLLNGIPNLNFTGVENLRGRSGADTFTFTSTGSISGSLDGGGGADTVDYSNISTGLTINLGDGSFENIETLLGGNESDTLIGPDDYTVWTIGAAGTGLVAGVSFSGFENFTGGDGDDTFEFQSNSLVSGTVDGGLGTNRLTYRLSNAVDTATIGAPIATINGVSTTYSNIQRIDLLTLGGEDQIAVNLSPLGFPEEINLETGNADDRIGIQLMGGVDTHIRIDGGDPSSSDWVTVTGTSDADSIIVDGDGVTYGSTTVSLTAVENLIVDAAGGDDTIEFSGSSVSGGVELFGRGGLDQIQIAFPISVGSLQVDGGGDSGDALDVTWTNNDEIITLRSNSVETAGSTTIQYSGVADLSLNALGGPDTIQIAATHSGTTSISAGEDSDTITVMQTSGKLSIDAGRGDDSIAVRSIGAPASIVGNDGEDTISVGSNAPGIGGVLSGIQALLTLAGDGEFDTLNIDNSGDLGPGTGSLSLSRLTGLGMSSGIDFESFDAMNVTLGAFGDVFDVVSTPDFMVLNLMTGAGADRVSVQSINGPTTIDTGEDADMLRILPSSALPVDNRFPPTDKESAINALLTVIGGDTSGQVDALSFDSPFSSVEPGLLTRDRLTGLQMPDGVIYQGWESFNIHLPIDTGIGFTIQSTHAGTTELATGIGVDTINIQSIDGTTTVRSGSKDDAIHVGSLAPTLGGSLIGIRGALSIDGEIGDDSLLFDDGGNTLDNSGTLTSETLSGLGMAGSIGYSRMESLRLDLGSGNDMLSVQSTHAGVSVLNTQDGNDTVDLRSVAGATTVNTGLGNDTVNVRSISAETTVNTGDGDDNVYVGSTAPATGGNVNEIGALLSIWGDADSDALYVDDSGEVTDNLGTLTANTLTGLGMAGSIAYSGLEELTIGMGSGADSMVVNGTHAGTTSITNFAGEDVVQVNDHLGRLTFLGGPDNDKLLLDGSYIHAPVNNPLVTFTRFEDGRQRTGYWSFNATQGLIAFESVERFNHLSKVVTPVGKILTNKQGIEVTAAATDKDYSGLVGNFTVGPVQPLVVDTRAFNNPDFVRVNADANADGYVSPLDALVVINQLNTSNSNLYRASYDVDKDGRVTPLDVLIVINRLNQPTSYVTVGGDYQITTRDLNNDGLAEILVVGSVNDRPVLLTLNGVTGGLFDAPIYLSDSPSLFTHYVTAGDIDGDGILEIIVSYERGPGKYSIYRRVNGQLVLSAERTVPFDEGYLGGVRVAAGDLNGDGKDEILVGSGVGTDASVRVYDSSGQVISTFVLPSSFARAGVLLKTGDYNGDGLLDLFVASGRRGSSQVAVFDGRTPMVSNRTPDHFIDNIFTDPSLIAPIDITLADSDGDELDELFVWQLSDGRNQGVKKFKYDKAVDEFFEEF